MQGSVLILRSMYINEDTKISALIRHNPKSIDAIVSISNNFDKLKNPILRKILASRVSIKQAAKIGGSTIEAFYDKLTPLGFEIKELKENWKKESEPPSNYYHDLDGKKIVDLDVRSILKEGKDPFNDIMNALASLENTSALKIINTFEPTPLISILSKKGYLHHSVIIEKQLVHTYFFKETKETIDSGETINESSLEEITTIIKLFSNRIKEIDVTHLEMPLPMSSILNELYTLPEDHLLFVHHKKVPKFLFPELVERGFQWRIQIISTDDIKLLIFK